jgi:hypothetical protein
LVRLLVSLVGSGRGPGGWYRDGQSSPNARCSGPADDHAFNRADLGRRLERAQDVTNAGPRAQHRCGEYPRGETLGLRVRSGSCFDHASAESFAEIVVKRYRLRTDDVTGRQVKEKARIALVYSPYPPPGSRRTKVPTYSPRGTGALVEFSTGRWSFSHLSTDIDIQVAKARARRWRAA